ncbi:MAG: tRNA (adenosine(37)-N6)-threonylcarbamoyltransferase complex dimerization subunit type 1 TsaB [Rubrimonas sp.]|uniref:tRNA (adenosine(37)-N6)-threonylcarbamoyltransferase complex dimerization subunit type 1 TsaB n=1 Tax=Rubrimonas sp. TaxID=2036015 RepID=UPI002FDD3F31
MRILALDATGARCAAGIFEDGALRAEAWEPMDRGHAERLFALIDAALSQARVRRRDIEAIAVATGPSGFTGARIGVAAARGLALGLGAPAVGAQWLEALGHGVAGACLVALPASGGVAAQRFRDGFPLGPPELMEADDPRLVCAPGETRLGPEALATAGLAPLARFVAERVRQGGAPAPAPLYLRPPDAAPSAHAPAPRI